MTYVVTKGDGLELVGRCVAFGETFEAHELGDHIDERRRARIIRILKEHRRIVDYEPAVENKADAESLLKYHHPGRYELPDGRIVKGKQAALSALREGD